MILLNYPATHRLPLTDLPKPIPAVTAPILSDDQPRKPYLPVYGFDVNGYLPAKKFRDIFGDTNTYFTPTFGEIAGRGTLSIVPSAAIVGFKKGANEATLIFLGVRARRFLSTPTTPSPFSTGAYATASLDGLYADLRAKGVGIEKKRWIPSASLGVGYSFNPRVGVEASYRIAGKVEKLPLSGLQIGVSLRF